LLQIREPFIDARNGDLVGVDVEVNGCVVDELVLLAVVPENACWVHTVAGSSSRSMTAVFDQSY
jgi:hypothetical protein